MALWLSEVKLKLELEAFDREIEYTYSLKKNSIVKLSWAGFEGSLFF